MKDFFQFLALCIFVGLLFVAVPVAGFVVGLGFGLWFMFHAWKEERNVHRD